MVLNYFLGANSKNGFYSLYEQFPGEGIKLHIIKSGPGTGKSSFMRKIGEAAEKRGYDVEYILCSGDPDSLDGVSIPALGHAWVDGTAPHVTEPGRFGIDSDYVNLGTFLDSSFSYIEKIYVNQFHKDYKQMYTTAYGYLKSAVSFREAHLPKLFGEEEEKAIKKRIDGIINRFVPKSKEAGSVKRRFLSALSCQGNFQLTEEVSKLCKQHYVIDNSFAQADFALEYAAKQAVSRGADVILGHSPLEPEKLEALLIPDCDLALLSAPWDFDKAWHIRLDSIVDASKYKKELREGRKTEQKLMDMALNKLKEAKALHDGLESVYKNHMDFEALDRYTEGEIQKLFG